MMKKVSALDMTFTEVADLCKKYSNDEYHLCAIVGGSPLTISICEEAQEGEMHSYEYASMSASPEGVFVMVWHHWKRMGVETLIDQIVKELGLDDASFVRFDSIHIVIHYTSRYVEEETK